MTTGRRAIPAVEFFATFLRVPRPGSRDLVPLTLHPEQRRLLEAYDERDPATGLPRYPELAALWLKKAGKSATAGGLVLAELVGGREPDREVLIVASDLAQARDVVFAAAVRFVKRHPWLAQHVRPLTSELIYTETVVDPRTGGRHDEDHVARAVPARDAKSLHGGNATLTVFDEYWTHNDYGAVEALGRSPARQAPRVLYASYAGLRSQRRAGVPLWDLWQRWQAGDDPQLFVSYIGGPDAWRSVPWITEAFLDAERRRFASVPSKYSRVYENSWDSGDDSTSFLSSREIQDAIDPTLVEPDRGVPGLSYTLGCDLGLSSDFSAAIVTHVDPFDHKLVVDVVRYWAGTRAEPVSLTAVENEIVALAKRFALQRTTLDQWQAVALAERLRARGVSGVRTITMETSTLDRHATMLKAWFAGRQIRIPSHPVLIEQLECLVGREMSRRDRVRFDTPSPNEHDDLAVALALAADGHGRHGRDIGRPTLPATFRECYRERTVPESMTGKCLLLGGHSIPHGDPSCAACPGRQALVAAHEAHLAAGGEALDLRRYFAERMEANAYSARRQVYDFATHFL